MTQTRNSNGAILVRDVRRENDGWGVNVWFGGVNGLGTNERRYVYETRQAARSGDISDEIGRHGRIA